MKNLTNKRIWICYLDWSESRNPAPPRIFALSRARFRFNSLAVKHPLAVHSLPRTNEKRKEHLTSDAQNKSPTKIIYSIDIHITLLCICL